jgi:hypothetical protein
MDFESPSAKSALEIAGAILSFALSLTSDRDVIEAALDIADCVNRADRRAERISQPR